MRNPPWTREELILALDLYFKLNPSHTSRTNPEMVELSGVLRSLAHHPIEKRTSNFRSPSAVYMKMCNFLRLDPSYKGTGLSAGGKTEVAVWEEFGEDRERLRIEAMRLRRMARHRLDTLPVVSRNQG